MTVLSHLLMISFLAVPVALGLVALRRMKTPTKRQADAYQKHLNDMASYVPTRPVPPYV